MVLLLSVLPLAGVAAAELTAEVGERQTVMADKYEGLRYFTDEPIGFIRRTPPLLFTLVAGNTTFLMQGRSLETAVPLRKVLEPTGKDGDYDSDYAGISSIHLDHRRGEILGFYHAERHRKNTVDYTGGNKWYGTIGLAISRDGGRSFTRQGPIITSSIAFNPNSLKLSEGGIGGVGDVSVCVDDTNTYLYAYYTDHSRINRRSVIICMARSKIEDGGRPGTWKKYYKGSFSTEGLGGVDTQVANLYGPNVTYVRSLKKYIMVGNRSRIHFCHSDDGIHWSDIHTLVDDGLSVPVPGKPTAMRAHLLILRSDAKTATGFLLYTYSPCWGGGESQTPHYFVKRPIRFTLEASPSNATAAPKEEVTVSRRLPRGAVLILTFEEDTLRSRNGEMQVDDVSRKGHVGVVEGATFAEGRVGKGLEVGEGKCVVVSGDLPSGSQPRTLAAWMKVTIPLRSWQIPMMQGQNWGAKGFGLHLYKGGGWGFHDYGPKQGDLKMAPADGEWHHHCITYDGSEVKHYFDGTLLASGQKTIATGTPRLVLGADPRKLHNLEGMIDEVVMFDRALSSEDVGRVYQMGVNGIPLAK